MKLFFDTEFTGLHKNTTLISIGIVSEDGRSFYAELDDYDHSQLNDWLRENVIANLQFSPPGEGEDKAWIMSRHVETAPFGRNIEDGHSLSMQGNKEEVRVNFLKWLRQFGNEKIVMFSDCLSYDWVLFVDIFGTAFDLPENIYYIPMDICTMLGDRGIDPDIVRELFAGFPLDVNKHNALYDAKIIRECYLRLNDPSWCAKFKKWC